MSDSPYANPQPYDTPELERAAIKGRLDVAKSIRDRARAEGRTRTADSWGAIVDGLLDRLANVDDRAASAALDRALREETAWTPGDPIHPNDGKPKRCSHCGAEWTEDPDHCPEAERHG